MAVYYGSADTLEALILAGADLSVENQLGWNPMIVAVSSYLNNGGWMSKTYNRQCCIYICSHSSDLNICRC